MPELKKNVNFQATPEEIASWKAQAHATRKTFSAWMRNKLNDVHVPFPLEAAITYVRPELPKPELENIVKITKPKGKCEHRLPKGSYCKRCEQTHG